MFPLTDFPLLGKGFAEVLQPIEAFQWKAIHMCKYLRVRTSSGLENLNILAPTTEETLRVSCCWNTHFPQSSLHTPCFWEILSIREQPAECLFGLKELAEGERRGGGSSSSREEWCAAWKPPDAGSSSCLRPAALLSSWGRVGSHGSLHGTGGVSSLKCLNSALLKQGNTQVAK